MTKPNMPHKSGRIINNDPWAILVALACLIIVASGVAIIVLCVLWHKYKKNRYFYERNISGYSYEMPSMMRPKEYEVQVNIFSYFF